MQFSELFDELPNGQISPNRPIKMGGLFMAKGSTISKNVIANGINLQAAWHKALICHMDGETLVIDRITDKS